MEHTGYIHTVTNGLFQVLPMLADEVCDLLYSTVSCFSIS